MGRILENIGPAIIPIAQEIGGGLLGVVTVVSWGALYLLWRRVNELQDRILEIATTMGKENRELLVATNQTIANSTAAINALLTRQDGR